MNSYIAQQLKPTLHATFKSIAWANDFRYKFEQSKAMHATDIWFAKGVSNTIAPNIGWSTDAPVWEDGLYIWSKTITTYGDGRIEETSPVCITGATGRSVDKIEEWYYLSNKSNSLEGGTWSKTPPTWTDGKYIWTKNKIIYKNPSGSEETAPINNTGGSGQKGETGTDARTVRLNNVIHAVHFDQDGLMPSVTSIAFPTVVQGFSGVTPYYEFKMGNTIVRGLSTDSSWTLNTSAMKYSDFPLAVTVNVVIGGQTLATDTVTIVGTKPGEDAYTVVLANESHTFAGDVSNAIAGNTTANVIAYRGGTQVGATIGAISGLPTGMASTIYSNDTTSARVTFTVTTSMTSPNGVVNIPVTVNGKSFTKVFNYAIAFKGAKGEKGTDGVAGKDGVGIKTTVLAYASSTSGTTTPTSGWGTTVPTVAPGNYLWTRTTWTYTDNSVENGYTVSRIGKDGNTGKDGVAGKDGVGISKTVIHYASSTNGTTAPTSGWITTVPSVAQGSYLWTRTTWTYTDGTNETGYTAARMGADGSKGDKGASGENATARNYLLDSKPSPSINSATYNILNIFLAEKPVVGETYSFTIKGELNSQKDYFGIWNSGGSVLIGRLTHVGSNIHTVTTKWTNRSGSNVAEDTFIAIYAVPSTPSVALKIEWATMVKGSVPLTEWVPAHEDMYKYVDDVEIGGVNLLKNSRTIPISSNNNATYPASITAMEESGRSFSRVRRTNLTLSPSIFSIYGTMHIRDINQSVFENESTVVSFKARASQNVTMSTMDTTFGDSQLVTGSLGSINVTTEWKTFYSVFPKIPQSTLGFRVNPLNNITNVNMSTFYLDLCEWKIEKGNKPTDWSPAPEDVKSDIDSKADSKETAEQIEQARKDLIDSQEKEVAELKAQIKTLDAQRASLETARQNDMDAVATQFVSALGRVSAVETNLGDQSADWNFINTNIKMSDEGLMIGDAQKGNYLLQQSNRLDFISNGTVVAYVSNNELWIESGVFTDKLTIGGIAIRKNGVDRIRFE